jgi:hypothetical protein
VVRQVHDDDVRFRLAPGSIERVSHGHRKARQLRVNATSQQPVEVDASGS